MTTTVTQGPFGTFDPDTRDKASLARKLALAIFGAGTAAQRATARADLLARPDFTAVAKTTAAETAQVIDLNDEGVTFHAKGIRKIRWKSVAVTGDSTFEQEWEQKVWGNDGTTPKLIGSPRLINATAVLNGTPVQYGQCHAIANYDSSDTAVTTVVGTSDTAGSTAGSSIGNVSTNTATLTHPIARMNSTTNTVFRRVLGVNASSDVATAAEALHASVYPIDATTMSIYTADLATPSADGFDDDGRLEVSFFILPPPSALLVMNSTHVELHIGHDATDNVYHSVELFIGPEVIYQLAVD
jgi:hypothetical protein